MLKVESAEKRPVLLCIKIKDEASRKPNGSIAKKVAKKLGKRKTAVLREEEEETAERPVKAKADSDEDYKDTNTSSSEREGESSNISLQDSASANITAQEKLASAEKRLAGEMELKKEKRLRYKTIIEENENHLKVLSKQIQDVEEAIKNKEIKIMEMKLERKQKPLFKKLGSQFNIAKSVLKKERLEDDLSVLKGRSATRRRIIQKYKTKIRYDLQILNDPSTTAVKPSQETRLKHTQRPIPPCFFVGDNKQQVTAAASMHSLVTADWVNKLSVCDKPSSVWSLSSVDDKANSLLAQRIQNERGGSNCGVSSMSGQLLGRSASLEWRPNEGCGLAPNEVVSSRVSGCDFDLQDLEGMEV